jgi:hypothetical protein
MSAHDQMVWLAWTSGGAAIMLIVMLLMPSPFEFAGSLAARMPRFRKGKSSGARHGLVRSEPAQSPGGPAGDKEATQAVEAAA